MSATHVPVLLDEAVSALAPKEGGVYVDATYGAGGYTRAIRARAACRVIAFDRDPDVARTAPADDAGFAFVAAPFDSVEAALAARGVEAIDGVVFDVGVSSMQIDDGARGFSFRHDGPLSMRMDRGRPDARDVVAVAGVDDLASIFKVYGEERQARRIARAIVAARENAPIETTGRLADIVARAAPARPEERTHPATKVFQALRIFVNDELGQLARALLAAERLLKPAGRLVVVTFHSLEDRIVKRFLADRAGSVAAPSRHAPPRAAVSASFGLLFRKPVEASAAEIAANPRARSARLRAAVRLAAPANPGLAFAGEPFSLSIDEWR